MATMTGNKIPPPPAVRWALQVYTDDSATLTLINSDLSLPHSLVFIGGLTDSLGSVSYLERVAQGIAPFGFSVTQLQLSSSLGGWGYCSLEGDAQEIALGVQWLRKKGKDKIILMGSSTGCQDIMQYLSYPDRGENTGIDAAVLQAPVSDREAWEYDSDDDDPEAIRRLDDATKLVKEGKGYQLLPRKVAPQLPKGPENATSDTKVGNVGAVNDPPMTAYRYWSLYAKGGDDDYFSTLDFTPEQMLHIWQAGSKGLKKDSKGHILALVGAEDETIPRPKITPESIVKAWRDAVHDKPDVRARFEILPGASHQVEDAAAQIVLAAKIRELIKQLGVQPHQSSVAPVRKVGPPPPVSSGIPSWQLDQSAPDEGQGGLTQPTQSADAVSAPSSSVPPHPPSFDALVELIASGRTDEIEGIRDIPLKINDEPPSESRMDAPKKPWETQ